MRSRILKTIAATALVVLFGAGAAWADGWKNESGTRGHAYGHYKHRAYAHHHGCPPPVYVEHRHYPVIVERHYYPRPVYAVPAPSGFFFGMSVFEGGSAFSFGMGGR